MNEVITLAATKTKATQEGVKPATLNVAAYARVSTDNLEQKTSYAAQISEYTERITSNPAWNMVGIYADEGLSATSMKKRDDFLRLLRDCRAGMIDLVLVKSISRFARNVEDSIHTVKELRTYGVDVFFEKENLHSIDPSTDVIFTILATFAQQESVSIGQNVKWGLRKKMKDGGLVGGTNRILGFDYENGNYVINEQEAETIRRIFHLYLHGKGYQSIANTLEKEGHATANGSKLWNRRTIQGIVCNEKYYGALLSQKTIVNDFLKMACAKAWSLRSFDCASLRSHRAAARRFGGQPPEGRLLGRRWMTGLGVEWGCCKRATYPQPVILRNVVTKNLCEHAIAPAIPPVPGGSGIRPCGGAVRGVGASKNQQPFGCWFFVFL